MTLATMAPASTAPEKIDHYRVLRFLGQGGMGRVYLVEDERTGRRSALKWLHRPEPRHAVRFRREFRTLERLRHPGIIEVYEAGTLDGRPYFTMEYLEGTDLKRALGMGGEAPPVPPGPRRIARAVRLVRELLSPLSFVHLSGVVHRDLKPGNIWVLPGDRVKLMDFGLGFETAERNRITTTGFTLGTPAYMAPEQALGERVDVRADIYALGVILYELVTGQLPFEATSPVQLAMKHVQEAPVPPRARNLAVSPRLSELILALLAKSPADRPAAVSLLASPLEAMAAELEELAERLGEDEELHGSPGAAPVALAATEQVEAAGELRGTAGGVGAAPTLPEGALLGPHMLLVPRFTGREGELDVVEGLLEGLEAGRPGVLFWDGEYGMGKSRLLQEARGRARFRPLRVESAAAVEGETRPLALFDGVLHAFADDLEEGPGRLGSQARRAWRRLVPLIGRSHYRFRELARSWRLPEPLPLPPDQERLRLIDALGEACFLMAGRQPLVLFLDDVHRADRLSADFTLCLARCLWGAAQQIGGRSSRTTPLLVVGTLSMADLGEDHPLRSLAAAPPGVLRSLRRLSDEDMGRMLRSLLPEGVEPPGLIDRVVAEAGGNPFFAEELLRGALADPAGLAPIESADPRSDPSIALRQLARATPDSLPLPEAVRRVLVDRWRRLPADVQELLRLMAPVGRKCEVELLIHLAERPETEVLDALGQAMNLGLLDEVPASKGERVAFHHDKLREVVLLDLQPTVRRRLHRRILAWLEERAERAAGEDETHTSDVVFRLACHAEEAGDQDKAGLYLRRAADLAERRGVPKLAVELNRRAVDALAEAPWQQRAAAISDLLDRLVQGAQIDRAHELGEQLLEMARSVGDRVLIARAHRARANILQRVGRHDESVQELIQGLNVLGHRMPTDKIRLLLALGVQLLFGSWPFLYYHWHNARALEKGSFKKPRGRWVARARELYQLYHMLSQNFVFVRLRNHLLFFELAFLRKLMLAEKLRGPDELIATFAALGMGLAIKPRPYLKGSKVLFALTRRAAHRLDRPLAAANVDLLAAFSHLICGHFDESRRLAARSRDAFRHHGDVHWELLALWVLGEAYYFSGDATEAEQYFSEVLETATAVGDQARRAAALALKALVAIESYRPDEARRFLARARGAGDLGRWGVEVLMARVEARLAAAQGDLEGALEPIRSVVSTFTAVIGGPFYAALPRLDLVELQTARQWPRAAPLYVGCDAPSGSGAAVPATTTVAVARAARCSTRDDIETHRTMVELAALSRHNGYTQGMYRRLRARRAMARGKVRRARKDYRASIEAFEQIGNRREAALSQLELAQLLLDQGGEPSEAAKMLLASEAVFRQARLGPPLARTHALLQRV